MCWMQCPLARMMSARLHDIASPTRAPVPGITEWTRGKGLVLLAYRGRQARGTSLGGGMRAGIDG